MNHKLNRVVSLIGEIVESDNVRNAHCGKCFNEIRALVEVNGNDELWKMSKTIFEMLCSTNTNDFEIGYELEKFKNNIKEYIESQDEALLNLVPHLISFQNYKFN